MATDEDTVVSSLPVRLSHGPLYFEHGFILVAAGDDEGYWQVDDPGVHAGPGWVRVGGGMHGGYVALDLVIRSADAADGPGPAPGAPLLTAPETDVFINEPGSNAGLTWPLDPGRYEVRASFVDLPSPDDLLPAQRWTVEMIGWPA